MLYYEGVLDFLYSRVLTAKKKIQITNHNVLQGRL